MRSLAACAILFLGVGAAVAQAPPQPDKGIAPLSPDRNEMRAATETQIEMLNKQVALLSQLVAQNQRGLVTYPIALALPGPINCQGNCRAAVADICQAVKYPNSYTYPALVGGNAIGVYVNGICYGP